MDRRVITPGHPDDHYGVDPDIRAGWFDADKAQYWVEEKHWDGNNMRGVASGSQCGYEELWLTKGGRYVLHRDMKADHNGGDHYYEIDLEAAQEWAVRAGLEEENLAEAFPSGIADEEEPRRPGRPAEGASRTVKMSQDLWDAIGAKAAEQDTDRSALIRTILRDHITPQAVTSTQ